MKYWIFVLLAFASGCTPSVDVEAVKQYKCGAEIVKASFLEDNSMILGVNGTNYVLNRSATNSGLRYDNDDSSISFTQLGRNTYLIMNGKNYPLCLELDY